MRVVGVGAKETGKENETVKRLKAEMKQLKKEDAELKEIIKRQLEEIETLRAKKAELEEKGASHDTDMGTVQAPS